MKVTRLQTSWPAHIVVSQKEQDNEENDNPSRERVDQVPPALQNLTHGDIAARAGCTRSIVSNVIAGRKVSANVIAVLVRALGYESFEQLIAGANQGGVV